MTSLKGDLRSIMGTPFGGVGHAVLIFSRVTRAAFNSDSVVLQLHDRIEMPEEADGKFRVDGLDPGPIRIELEGGTVHNHGWNIDLPDEGVWSLTDLVDAQVDWSPAVIGRAEAAAREARDHADRAEAGADRVGTAEQVGVWASEASASASSAASAESGAIGARDASQSARDAAEGHANSAATSESNAKTSETNAKQSETNAGDYAAVATTAATEAVDAMESASDAADSIANSVSEAAGHADRASQSESGAAAYAQNASDAADRVGTAEQVGTWAQQAQDAADRIGTAETVEGWANSARDSASAAGQSETKAKEHRDAAFSAASSTADELRGDLINIAGEASSHATESSRSAARAKASETNAATHEANSLSAAERAEFAAEETIQQVEGDFATRNYVDAAKWYRGIAGASSTLDSVAEGSWGVAGSAAAQSLGLPRVSTGTLMISRMNNSAGRTAMFITSTHTRNSPEVWFNSTANSGGWGDWVNLSAGFAPSTKQAAVPLTFPRGSSYSDDRETLTMRIPFKFGAAVKRARLRLRNYDYRSDHGFPGSYRIVGAGIGKHQINDDGSMTGLIPEGESITQLMGSTQMAGPDEAAGDWVDVDLEPNTDYLLSYSFTADDGMVYTRQTAQCFTNRLSSGWNRTGATTATPSNMAVLAAILDVEVLEDTPVYGYLGDSQTAAISASRPGYDSWAMVHSRLAGAIPTIHGHAGGSLNEWQDSAKPAYAISEGMARFDRFHISMGSNDISGGRPYAGVQQYLTTAMQNWRKQTDTFVLHNYLPRTSDNPTDTVRDALNDWVLNDLPGNALYAVDVWNTTVDPSTGLMAERWRGSPTDVHMSSAGNARVAMATFGGVIREPVGGVLEAYNQAKGL